MPTAYPSRPKSIVKHKKGLQDDHSAGDIIHTSIHSLYFFVCILFMGKVEEIGGMKQKIWRYSKNKPRQGVQAKRLGEFFLT